MSDTHLTEEQQQEIPFTPAELKQFDKDDSQAGAAIGKMLSFFFLYTVLVMSFASVATYWWIHYSSIQ